MAQAPPPQPPDPAGPTPAPRVPAPRRRARRVALGLLLATLALVLLGSGGAWWAWHQASTLPWLLQQVPGMTLRGVQGSLASGQLHIAMLDWQLPAQGGRLRVEGLQIDGVRSTLRPRPGIWIAWQVDRVRATQLQFDSGPPSAAPLRAPADLRLPLDLQIRQLAIGALRVDTLPPMQGLQATLSLGAGPSRQHRIDALSLTLEAGSADAPAPLHLQGHASLGSDAPLTLQAMLQVQRDRAPAWQATLQAQGPLAKLTVTALLSGEATAPAAAPRLQAQAQVQPFATWPLGALSLQTEALNLAALSPRLPRTQLSGSAQLLSQGLDQPAQLNATLDNTVPDAWDRGGLPLRRLQLRASGTPRQTDRLTLDQAELQLADANGPAGRLTGQGQWRADTLALDLQLDQLQPARLHHRAAALLLGGPVTLRLAGLPVAGLAPGIPAPAASTPARPAAATTLPTLAVDARLAGRLLDGSGLPVQLQLQADGNARQLHLRRAEARAGTALANAEGQASAEAAGWRLRGQAAMKGFDPRPWWRGAEGSAWRRGPHRLDGRLTADLLWRSAPAASGPWTPDRLLAAIDGAATLTLQDSQLAGVPLSGSLALHGSGASGRLDASLDLAGNRLALQGQTGATPSADRWHLTLQAPTLATLAPLGPVLAELLPGLRDVWPQAGALSADLQAGGRWPALHSQGELQAKALSTSLGSLQAATLRWRHGSDGDAPLSLQLSAQGLASGAQRLDQLQLTASGTPHDHALKLLADSPLRLPVWTENLLGPAGSGTRLEAEARGRWVGAAAGASSGASPRYQLQAMTLHSGARDAQGGSRPWLAAQDLSGELLLRPDGSLQTAQLAPGRVQLLSTALNWRELRWQTEPLGGPNGGRLDLEAELERIDVARLLARAQPEMGWTGDLTLGGRISVHSAARFDADVVLARGGGDLSITDDLGVKQALGLTELRLALTAHDGLWQFAQGLAGERIGTIAGAQLLRSSPERRWPAAGSPLQGVLEAHVADLGVWGTWVPPGWRLSGALDTSAQVGGTLGAAQFKGTMQGRDLGLRNLLQGVSLSEGQLALQLDGDNARIERLAFKGGDGRLNVTGGATLGAHPRATLQLVADKFHLLGRIDRRIVASGSATLDLDADRLKLDGAFTVDEGLVDIGRGDAPALDGDVTVHRAGISPDLALSAQPGPAPLPTPLRQAQVNLRIGLGDKLRLRGLGVDTGLRGDLVVSSPGGRLALNGTVRTVDGRYAAYGQKMEITRGVVSFNGAMDNPRLDVLAVRPNLDVVVGVLIDGAASNPRIRLYSEPEMADYDRLSWLVMGRSPDGLGSADTALLQRAAYALLAGDSPGPTDQLLGALGLTDFSLRQTDGDTRDTIISLGKQLSRRWYVGYERGVHATTGTWQLIYRIAQRFTLRAQSGGENALDLIWTWRW